MKAIWKGQVVAESNDTVVVEGNHYFPPESIHKDYFKPSTHSTFCSWKGKASYYSLEVDGEVNENAAWYYPNAEEERAKKIEGYVAFWKGVRITE